MERCIPDGFRRGEYWERESQTLYRDVLMTRILIADDHEIMRQGVRSVLESRRDVVVCAQCEPGLKTRR
jgi:PleD family two-component response regulator